MTIKVALDTNAYRALDDGNEQLANVIKTVAQIGMPLITLGELYYGIFGGNRQEKSLAELNRFLSLPRIEILDIDEVTAKNFGEIGATLKRIGKPIQQNDMWIAALCKQYGYALATNDGGFRNITGLEVISF